MERLEGSVRERSKKKGNRSLEEEKSGIGRRKSRGDDERKEEVIV